MKYKDIKNEAKSTMPDPEYVEVIKKINKDHQHAKVKDPVTGKKLIVDAFSASGFVQVWNQLDDKQKEKFQTMTLEKQMAFVYKFL